MLYNEPQYKQASDQQAREEDNFIITDYPDFLSRKSSYFDPEYGHQQFFEEWWYECYIDILCFIKSYLLNPIRYDLFKT